jgi:hypothetical protein
MRTSEQTDKIDGAIAMVQAHLDPITKNKRVDVESKRTGEQWSSGYVTLAALYEAVHPLLSEHRIVVYQGGDFVQGLGPVLVTRLAHEGQWIESFFPVKTSKEGAQGFGGGVSFARRWGLCSMLNLIPDDVEEGQGYRDARREAKAPRKASAPGGLGALLDTIRSATLDTIADSVQRARGAHPTGEASSSVERTIESWFVNAFDNVNTIDALTAIRDAANRLKPRGSEVRAALTKAALRLEQPR